MRTNSAAAGRRLALRLASLLAVIATSALGQAPDPKTVIRVEAETPSIQKDIAAPPTRRASPGSIPTLTLPEVAPATMALSLLPSQPGRPKQIGVGRPVAALETQTSTRSWLSWQPLEDGATVAAIGVSSPGARAIRMGVLVETLPSNATLRFYSLASERTFEVSARSVLDGIDRNAAAGDKDETGRTYWSPVIEGSTVVLEIELPAGIAADAARFSIPSISHLLASPQTDFGVPESAACNLDAMCYQPTWGVESNAVAKMIFAVGSQSFLCSGTLLADRDISTTIPYFLTANHCISTQASATSLNTYWFYRSTSCNSGLASSSYVQKTDGATLLYQSGTTDTSFMRLMSLPPQGATYAGWIVGAPPSVSQQLVGLHHPAGDLLKITYEQLVGYYTCTPTSSTTFSCSNSTVTASTFYGLQVTSGSTEGGSSGSGIFDINHYLVGQLYGGSGSCTGASTYYGRLDVAYNAGISQWLGSTGITAPAAPTTIAPSGVLGTPLPTYSWNSSSGADSYTLLVQNTAGVLMSISYSATAAGCSAGGVCSVTPATPLVSGASYNWFVNASNAGGVSAWSAGRAISYGTATPTSPPAAPATLAPSGLITTTTPVYSWTASAGADTYYLLVQNTAGVLIGASYTAAAVGCGSGTGTCSITPTIALTTGSSYNWFVSATNAFGTSAWSTARAITVNSTTTNVFPAGCVVPAGWVNMPTGATSGWGVAFDSASEGTCSLKSSPMVSTGSPQKAQIQFTGTFNAGNITFDRRVSSESGWDCFRFMVDGVQQGVGGSCNSFVGPTGASGDVPWGSVSIPISAGAHTITWSYEKDASVDAGLDAAWIDNVVMPITVTVPIAPYPLSPDGVVGTTLPTYTWLAVQFADTYTLQVQNTAGVAYSLTYTAAAACGTSTVCSVTPGTPLASAAYNWFIKAVSAGGASPWSEARAFRVDLSAANVFPAGCTVPTAGWTNAPAGSTTGWNVATDFRSEGTCSLKSNPMTDAPSGSVNKAQIQFAGTFTAGNVVFDRRVSSEYGFDCLRFVIDGMEQAIGGTCVYMGGTGASGESPFTTISVPISAGAHTLTWSYEKDASVSRGGDAAWIDNLMMPIGVPIPAAPTTIAPSGTITTTTPTYSWNASAGATTYNFLVQNTAGALINTSYSASAVGCAAGTGTCSVTPAIALGGGFTYNWFVSAANATGTSAWSAARTVTVSVPTPPPPQAPPVPVTVSPTGNLTTTTPTYSWNASTGATSYMLLVQNTAGALINTSYSASALGCASGGTCSITPANALAAASTYNWFVNASNATATSAWSAARTITAPIPPPGVNSPPPAPAQVAPSGAVSTTTPAYTWNAVASAASYYLQVQNTAGVAVGLSYSPAAAGCGAGTGTCSVTPGTALTNGNTYVWFVNGSNPFGTGPWSAGLTFTVSGAGPSVPLAPVTVSPSGNTTTLPTYNWNASAGATSYYLLVQNTAGVAVGVTYAASSVGCGAGTGMCSVTPGVALTSGAMYNWFVNASNSLGTSAWSAALSITVGTGTTPTGPPLAPTPIAPSGNLGTATPIYSWNASAGATSYYLLVQNTAGVAVGISYSAAIVGCSTGTGICSVQPAGALAAATAYNWFVNASNASGTSAWSAGIGIRTP